jgi:hypothetical protein
MPDNYECLMGTFVKPIRRGHPNSNPGTSTILVAVSILSARGSRIARREKRGVDGFTPTIFIIADGSDWLPRPAAAPAFSDLGTEAGFDLP